MNNDVSGFVPAHFGLQLFCREALSVAGEDAFEPAAGELFPACITLATRSVTKMTQCLVPVNRSIAAAASPTGNPRRQTEPKRSPQYARRSSGWRRPTVCPRRIAVFPLDEYIVFAGEAGREGEVGGSVRILFLQDTLEQARKERDSAVQISAAVRPAVLAGGDKALAGGGHDHPRAPFPRTSCRKPLVVVVAGEQEVADPSGRYAGLPEPLAEDARVLFVAGIEQDVCSRPLRDGRSILSASAG